MRIGRLPAWVWVLGAWGLLVAGAALLELRWGVALETCLFRRATGIPCPTCGSTRSVLALLRGEWGNSLQASPLLWVAAVSLLLYGAARLIGGDRSAVAEFQVRPRHLLLGLGLLLGNWIWVLLHR
jgi:hypothetical protein